MDSETIELVGRNRVVDELLRAGVEVALPIRDRGIDLIAYADLDERTREFVACPIQIKASSGRSFSIDQKFESVPHLIHAFVWGIGGDQVSTYALSHREALEVADLLGYTLAPASQKDLYAPQAQNRNLLEVLDRFRMSPDGWRRKILSMRD